MQINDIKKLSENIGNNNLKLFVDSINGVNISLDSKNDLMEDLGKLLNYTKTELDKKRVNNYIDKINRIKSKEQEEKNNELLEISLNY